MWFSVPSHDALNRPRAAIAALLSTAALASAGYYYFYHIHGDELGRSSGALHRSNAVRRPRRNSRRRSRSTPAPRGSSPAPSTTSTDDGAADQAAQEIETVVDGMDDWYNEPQPQRAGHNIVTLLFRVSEDNSRRNACVHRGCQCNACSMAPIRGIRYRCATCADFDLCESCEAQGLHYKTHIFYKIKVPAPPSSLRQMQPVWYTGDPDSVHRTLSRSLMSKLSRETGFERPELEAYWEQWTYMAATEWRLDPDDLCLAMDRKTFERCLIPSGGSQHMAPNLIHERMFDFYDTNNDGLIGFTEFLHGVAFRNRRDKLERIFKGYDLAGDGYIDRKNCLRMFRAYYVLFKEMHKDVLDGLDDQVMSSTEAQRLVASRQPLSSLFGQELTRMPPPDHNPDRLQGKVYYPNGHVDLPAGRTHAVRDERGDTASRRSVLNRLFVNGNETGETFQVSVPAPYAETLLDPLVNVSAIQAILSSLDAEGAFAPLANPINAPENAQTTPLEGGDNQSINHDNGTSTSTRENGQGGESSPSGSGGQRDENAPTQGRRVQTVQITIPDDGEGEVHVSVTASDSPDNPEQERSARRRARRQLHERWRRRQFYLDEEEGARAPRGWHDDDDILARTLEDLERAKEREAQPEVPAVSPRSRSNSKVRFAGDTEDVETRSNVSTSSRTVPERWGGMDIPDAERDAGKEILYQIAQQAFNEMLDHLFKEKEDIALEVAETREEREKYRDDIARSMAAEGGDAAEERRRNGVSENPAVSAEQEQKNGTSEVPEQDANGQTKKPEAGESGILGEAEDGEYHDPTLPQFRPNSDADIPTHPCPALLESESDEPGSSKSTSLKSEDKDDVPTPQPIAKWNRLNKEEAEAIVRGGYGKLNYREFEEIYRAKEEAGHSLAYLGSWIEFCIP
ncbi:uncharacterized protein DNG_04759 [Cephalotrichum gorgonifer]|uniref:Uncharacterized protein n=1 Tax=Cephalotrichum gorgonifer TaxID=2041049 RepID=A0AAE8SUV6_9PEZI|nr:uncharacterized protein DNG_04759 [Cephalotrichum gorgonifer]